MNALPPARETSEAPPPAPEVAALLADKAALWETLQATTREYVAVVDRAGYIRWCNRVDDGFTLDQVVGHRFVRFTVPDSTAALTRMLEQVFEDGQTRSVETTVRRLDGSFNYFAIHLAPLRRGDRIVAIMACCENIRPLKATEQELRHERNVLRRLLDIQERERQLVSYEIHDGLAQYLAGGLMHLQACQHACPPEAAADLEQGLRLVQAAAEESRRLIGGLRPPALDELGLVAAVESLADDARAEIGDVSFTPAVPGGRLPAAVETTVFRIVQEAITNARRHSDAGRLRIDIVRTDGHVRLVVADDGRGFNPVGVPEDRFGLEGIRQRSRLLGGESRITTAPGRGTTVEVTLPVPQV
jgi:PAS domain S-box-containing protein